MRTALIVGLAAVLGAWLALWLRGKLERLRGRAAQARGKRGELDAERLLLAHGYRIRQRQARTAYEIEVDGVLQRVPLIIDFMVERGGEVFVAEVKTGTSAPRLSQPNTRRQLLEYQLATDARQVLLVDPEAERITQVAFPLAQATTHTSAWPTVASFLCVLAALCWWQLHKGSP